MSEKKSIVRVTHRDLLKKLEALDERLLNIWLQEDSTVSDEEVWEMFVILLETRVEILKTCQAAGIKLNPDVCLPAWLERLANRKMDLRLREIKVMAENFKKRKTVEKYEAHVLTSEELAE